MNNITKCIVICKHLINKVTSIQIDLRLTSYVYIFTGAANDTIERALGNRSNRRGGNSARNRGSNSVVRTGNKSKGNNQQGGGQRGNSVRRRRVKRNAMKDSRRYWPNKTLVYKYTASSFCKYDIYYRCFWGQ